MNERILVQQILSGNRKAFQKLIKQYERLVSHMVGRIIKNKEEHEEVCQDVFIKVYQSLEIFRFESRLSTWIATIAYRMSLNIVQKKGLEMASMEASENFFMHEWATSSNPETALMQKDTAMLIRRMVDDLPVHYKTVLTLFHLEEMSYPEIVEITGMPEGTVKNYLFRARKLLKEGIELYFSKENQMS